MRNGNYLFLRKLFRQIVALLLCSFLIMHNDFFVSQSLASESAPRPDAHRLSGCEDTSHSGGDQCTIQTVEYDHQDIIITEGYYSMLVLWVAALIAILQLKKCAQGGNCGWSTLFSSVAGLALLAGEIVQIAMYSEAKDKIEYRPDMLRKYKDTCAGTGSGSSATLPQDVGSGVGAIDGMSICDQYAALMAQKKNYEKAKQAAEIKMALQIAAAAAFAIAAGIEYYGAITLTTEVSTLMAEGTATIAANTAAAAECGLPPAVAACEVQSQACNALITTSISALASEQAQINSPAGVPSQAQRATILAAVLAADTALSPCLAGVTATSASAYLTHFHTHYTTLYCPGGVACNLGGRTTGGAVWVRHAPGLSPIVRNLGSRTTGGVVSSIFFQRPYYYSWQNFYFQPSKDDFFKGIDREELVSTQMQKMEIEALVNGKRQSPFLVDYQFLQHLDGPDFSTQNESNLLQKVLGQIIPSAQAEVSAANVSEIISKTLGLAGTAVVIILALIGVTDTLGDLMFGTPLKRGLWNTLTAALAGGGAIYTKYGVIDKLQENITTIENILKIADATKKTVRPPGSTRIPNNSIVIDVESLDGAPIISNENPPLPCPNGGDGKGKCKDVASDMSVTLKELNLGSLAGISSSLASLGKELGGSRDVGPGAMRAATNLAANAARAKKFLKDTKNLYNQSRSKLNLSPVPFDKLERDLMKGLFSKSHDVLKANKTNAESLLANMKNGELDAQDKKRFSEKVQDFEAKKAQAGGAVAGAAADPFAAFALQNMENPDISLDAEAGINPGTEGEVAIDSSLVIRSNDIETNPAVSLFDMLTSRYMKTAYPVLFEEQR